MMMTNTRQKMNKLTRMLLSCCGDNGKLVVKWSAL